MVCGFMHASKRENLARIHDVFRVQRALDGAHHVDGAITCLCHQKIHLVQSYAVLACAGPLERQRPIDQLVVKRFGYLALFRNRRVDQVTKVEVAVADMADQKVR